MRKDLGQIFDSFDESEIDLLLEDTPDIALNKKTKRAIFKRVELGRKPHFVLKRAVLVAACLVLVIGLAACAAEAKTYNDAIHFFNENNLSTEGLDRGEIKEVYRDITTRSFNYEKTAWVLTNSLAKEIEGYDITQPVPSTEALWGYKTFNGRYYVTNATQTAYCKILVLYGERLGVQTAIESTVKRYVGSEVIWETSIADFAIDGYTEVSDGIIVYGERRTITGPDKRHAYIAKLSYDGNVLWQKKLPGSFDDEYIADIVENTDGTYAVISRGDFNYLCLYRFSKDGEKELFAKTEIGKGYGISNAALLGDGYIVRLSGMDGERILKMDSSGRVTDAFSYGSDDTEYFISDMIEFDGNIYLSARAVPKVSADNSAGGRYEIAPVLNEIFDKQNFAIKSDKMTELLKKNYTAVLLVCNSKSGVPLEFYSVKGSLGGDLSVNDKGQLVWDVEGISSGEFSIATSAYSVVIRCKIFKYTFEKNGSLYSQEETTATIARFK